MRNILPEKVVLEVKRKHMSLSESEIIWLTFVCRGGLTRFTRARRKSKWRFIFERTTMNSTARQNENEKLEFPVKMFMKFFVFPLSSLIPTGCVMSFDNNCLKNSWLTTRWNISVFLEIIRWRDEVNGRAMSIITRRVNGVSVVYSERRQLMMWFWFCTANVGREQHTIK